MKLKSEFVKKSINTHCINNKPVWLTSYSERVLRKSGMK